MSKSIIHQIIYYLFIHNSEETYDHTQSKFDKREANITQTNLYTLKILKNLKFKRFSKSMKVSQIPKYVPKIEISKSSKSALIRFQENCIHLDFSELLFDKQLC